MSGRSVIRRIASNHRSGKPIAQSDLSHLLEGLLSWVDARGCMPLERCLGLRQRGGVSPQYETALMWRNNELVRLRRECADYSALSHVAAAKRMAADARKFQSLNRRHVGAREPARTFAEIQASAMKIPDAKQLLVIFKRSDLHEHPEP